MKNWQPVARDSEIPIGTSKEVEFQGRLVALFNVNGNICAIDGICPHQGAPLSDGLVTDCLVTCPWHGWQFHVGTGRNVHNDSVSLDRHDVRVKGGEVYLAIP